MCCPAGAPFLPYLITDKVVAPPHLHYCYSEHLALMPNCYFVNDYKRCHRYGHGFWAGSGASPCSNHASFYVKGGLAGWEVALTTC